MLKLHTYIANEMNYMNISPTEKYLDLMKIVRTRFDLIEEVRKVNGDKFLIAETCGFHFRKILEAIGSGCLIALEHGTKNIHDNFKYCYKPDQVFRLLKKKNQNILPSPSIIREATQNEEILHHVKVTIEGQPQKRLTIKDIIDIYSQTNDWNHEINPYSGHNRNTFYNHNAPILWENLIKIWVFIEKHIVSINGSA